MDGQRNEHVSVPISQIRVKVNFNDYKHCFDSSFNSLEFKIKIKNKFHPVLSIAGQMGAYTTPCHSVGIHTVHTHTNSGFCDL